MIASIQPDDEDFMPYEVSIAELADFLGISRDSAYGKFKKITVNLPTRVLAI